MLSCHLLFSLNAPHCTLGEHYYFPSFIGEKIKAQSHQGTGPKSHTQEVGEPEFKFQSPCSEPLRVSSPAFSHRLVLRLREAQAQPANGWSRDPGSRLQTLSRASIRVHLFELQPVICKMGYSCPLRQVDGRMECHLSYKGSQRGPLIEGGSVN